MASLLWLLLTILDLMFWIVIIMVIFSWLVAFNIVNLSNQFVRQLHYGIYRLTEPLLGPIRRFLPNLGGLDLSPLVLIIGILFAKRLLVEYWPM